MLIDSENLLARIDKCYQESAKTGLGLEPIMAIRDIKALISVMPTVDAAPVVHGRWQWLSSTYDRIPCEVRYRCEKCHHETITHGYEPWEKYCPNCGAKMAGNDE